MQSNFKISTDVYFLVSVMKDTVENSWGMMSGSLALGLLYLS